MPCPAKEGTTFKLFWLATSSMVFPATKSKTKEIYPDRNFYIELRKKTYYKAEFYYSQEIFSNCIKI